MQFACNAAANRSNSILMIDLPAGFYKMLLEPSSRTSSRTRPDPVGRLADGPIGVAGQFSVPHEGHCQEPRQFHGVHRLSL